MHRERGRRWPLDRRRQSQVGGRASIGLEEEIYARPAPGPSESNTVQSGAPAMCETPRRAPFSTIRFTVGGHSPPKNSTDSIVAMILR